MTQKLHQSHDLSMGQITAALNQNVKQLRVRRDIKRDLKNLKDRQSTLHFLKVLSLVGAGALLAALFSGGLRGLRTSSIQALRSIVHASEPRHFPNQPTNFIEQQDLLLENQQLRQRIIELEVSQSQPSDVDTVSVDDQVNDDDDYF